VGIGPNTSKIINALSKLKWMAVGDNYELETATFWKAPKQYGGPAPKDIQTEVFQLPCTGFAEKDGTFTNSARWVQWQWKAVDPPGQTKPDQEILSRIFVAVRELYRKEGGALPEPVLNVSWNYTNPGNPDLAEVLKDGPRTSREIWEMAEPLGHAQRTLDRARDALKIRTRRAHRDGRKVSYWMLPG